MYFDDEMRRNFERDGYVLLPEIFAQDEVNAMIADIEGGDRVAAATREKGDASGRKTKLAIWHELGADIWAAASVAPRVVNNVRMVLGEEIAFFHGKVMLKEAGQGGAWEWHQDYGYWYNQGFAFPRMLSAFVALDAATKENGCLQVLRGSHLLGRLNHDKIADQTGIDPQRIAKLEPLFERVYVEMKPGSVLFFHCNLLHSSGPNVSEHHRRSFIICYNALANPQITDETTFESRPCPVGPENGVRRFIRS